MNAVQVRSRRSTRFEFLSTRNLFLTCGTMALLLGAAHYSISGPVTSALRTEGQVSYAPRAEDCTSLPKNRSTYPLRTQMF